MRNTSGGHSGSGLNGRFAARLSAIQRKVLTHGGRARRATASYKDMAAQLSRASEQVRRGRRA